MRIYILAMVMALTETLCAQSKPEVVFRIAEKDLIPEGITYDPSSKVFYVGSTRKGKIIQIASNGEVSDFKPAIGAGMLSVLGMTVKNSKLWVCHNSPEYDSTQFISLVHIFDLRSGAVAKKYLLNDGKKHLFNDVVVASNGIGYVTDSDGGAVYRLDPSSDTVETFLKPGALRYPNGIALSPDEKKLLVSTGSGLGIVSIDLASKAVEPLRNEKYLLIGNDGLYRYKQSLIAVQNVTYPESILEYHCNDSFTAITQVSARAMMIPEFDTPTTGVVVGDDFYFIANSQLLQMIGNKGQIKRPADLKETLIMRLRLN